MAFYFAPIAEGLGDLLITLPGLQALIETGTPTYLIVRSPKQMGVAELIPGLAGWLKEPDFLSLELQPNDRFINMRNHPLPTQYVFGADSFFQEWGRISIVDVSERICKDLIGRDLNIDYDFRKYKRFEYKRDERLEQMVLFVPGSAGSFKCWPSAHWIDLYKRLLSSGVNSAVVGQPEKSKEVQELLDANLPWIPTPSLARALEVVSSAAAMVSVDTGLLHLSVHQGRPSIGLYFERSIFARPEPNCFPILAPDCDERCLGWIDLPPNPSVHFPKFDEIEFVPCSAPRGSRCMDRISVNTVLNRLLAEVPQLLAPPDCSQGTISREIRLPSDPENQIGAS